MDSTSTKIDVSLTHQELALLLHFATIGQNHIHVRNNFGDRDVAVQLDPIVRKLTALL